MKKILLPAALLSVLLVGGCANTKKPVYHWGQYQDLVYKGFVTPAEATPDMQITQLETDIENAQSTGQKIPPGLYAHLALMYAANGDKPSALAAFEQEKTLFPESTVLIDGMIERSKKKAQ